MKLLGLFPFRLIWLRLRRQNSWDIIKDSNKSRIKIKWLKLGIKSRSLSSTVFSFTVRKNWIRLRELNFRVTRCRSYKHEWIYSSNCTELKVEGFEAWGRIKTVESRSNYLAKKSLVLFRLIASKSTWRFGSCDTNSDKSWWVVESVHQSWKRFGSFWCDLKTTIRVCLVYGRTFYRNFFQFHVYLDKIFWIFFRKIIFSNNEENESSNESREIKFYKSYFKFIVSSHPFNISLTPYHRPSHPRSPTPTPIIFC